MPTRAGPQLSRVNEDWHLLSHAMECLGYVALEMSSMQFFGALLLVTTCLCMEPWRMFFQTKPVREHNCRRTDELVAFPLHSVDAADVTFEMHLPSHGLQCFGYCIDALIRTVTAFAVAIAEPKQIQSLTLVASFFMSGRVAVTVHAMRPQRLELNGIRLIQICIVRSSISCGALKSIGYSYIGQ